MQRLAFDQTPNNCLCTPLLLCGCWPWQKWLICVPSTQEEEGGKRSEVCWWEGCRQSGQGKRMEMSVPSFLFSLISRHKSRQEDEAVDFALDRNYRQCFWKSVILTKHQLDKNPVVIILLPLKATRWIWVYPGLTFKLKLAVFNCVSIIGMSPKPLGNMKEYYFLSWRGKIIKTTLTRWKISIQLSLFCACRFNCVSAPCHGACCHLELVPGIHIALW